MASYLSVDEKCEIKVYLENKMTQNAIALKYGVSQITIVNLQKKFVETNSVARTVGSGRSSLLSEKDIQYLIKKVDADPRTGSKKLSIDIAKEKEKVVSSHLIRLHLSKNRLKGRIACKKPFLTNVHIEKRNS